MTEKEIIQQLMKKQGKSNVNLAHNLKISPAALWDRLKNPEDSRSLTCQKVVEMIEFLDYELVIMPRGKSGNIKEAYVVTVSEKKSK